MKIVWREMNYDVVIACELTFIMHAALVMHMRYQNMCIKKNNY